MDGLVLPRLPHRRQQGRTHPRRIQEGATTIMSDPATLIDTPCEVCGIDVCVYPHQTPRCEGCGDASIHKYAVYCVDCQATTDVIQGYADSHVRVSDVVRCPQCGSYHASCVSRRGVRD